MSRNVNQHLVSLFPRPPDNLRAPRFHPSSILLTPNPGSTSVHTLARGVQKETRLHHNRTTFFSSNNGARSKSRDRTSPYASATNVPLGAGLDPTCTAGARSRNVRFQKNPNGTREPVTWPSTVEFPTLAVTVDQPEKRNRRCQGRPHYFPPQPLLDVSPPTRTSVNFRHRLGLRTIPQ